MCTSIYRASADPFVYFPLCVEQYIGRPLIHLFRIGGGRLTIVKGDPCFVGAADNVRCVMARTERRAVVMDYPSEVVANVLKHDFERHDDGVLVFGHDHFLVFLYSEHEAFQLQNEGLRAKEIIKITRISFLFKKELNLKQ